jgi:mono/diheme cytochrome c family protein
MHLVRSLSCVLAFAAVTAGFAQKDQPVTQGARPKWDMDYGPFLNLTVQMPGENPGSTPKGLAIRVGSPFAGTVVYDTDLLRCTGGWTGGFLDQKGVAFNGSHGGNPGPVGSVVFRTSAMPGWSKAGSFSDPRALPKGFGASEVPYGPLPKEWAQYKGLYRQGERVTVSYTVGGADILESPGIEGEGEGTALIRSFQVRSAGEASTVLVAEVPDVAALEQRDGCIVLQDNAAKADSRLVLRAVGAPEGARWKMVGPGKVGLELPKFKGGERFKIVHSKTTLERVQNCIALLKNSPAPEDLTALLKPGKLLWPETVKTAGRIGEEAGAYQLDTITLPMENPWRSWLRLGGLDFFKDGRIAFSTFAGDVWIGSGIDNELKQITWKRFAAGLHQPLGLRIVDDVIHLTCRDGLVRLRDLNEDGEADVYEMFNNQVQVTPNFHEFMFDLQTDSKGNFFFAKGGPVKGGGRGWDPIAEHNGTIMRVSKDGSKFDVFATGVRAPNGLGMGPGDILTTGDNEGTWVPMCYLHIVKEGAFTSVPDLAHREQMPKAFEPHVCFFPKSVDNSSGGQVWVTSDKWGPMKGRLLHLSYGQASLYEVMTQEVNGVVQGGVTKVPLKFATGLMRGRFSERDGQLYLAGQRGWQTSGTEEGAVQRVRYVGGPSYAPKGLRVTDRGIHIDFQEPLDPESAADADNYSIEQYNYRWTSNYGSKDYRPSNPDELGHDVVDITGVALSSDRKSVFLAAAGLQPVMQSEITMRIKSASGQAVPEKIWHTINAVAHEEGAALPLAVQKNQVPSVRTAGSGVALTLQSGGKEDVRKDRLIALHVPADSYVSPFLPKGQFNARWDAVLMTTLRKNVTFYAEGSGRVQVSLNGLNLFEGELALGERLLQKAVELRKGGNEVVIQYQAPSSGDSTFRFLWSSDDFGIEPVQPASLYMPASLAAAVGKGTQLRLGRSVFAEANCVACHSADNVLFPKGGAPHGMPEMAGNAPQIFDAGNRFKEAWLTRWISNPHDYRPGSMMPAIFKGASAEGSARDIAAFLAGSGKPAADPVFEQSDVSAGAALFGNLGCIACHSTPRSKSGNNFDRVPLAHVSSKWYPASLIDYLLDPHKNHPSSRMPKTALSQKEAHQLAGFLMSFPAEKEGDFTKGNVENGGKLLAMSGCIQCHAGGRGMAKPLLATLQKGWDAGCLAEDSTRRGNAPDFRFTSEQVSALKLLAKEGVASVDHDSPLEFAQRAVVGLRCVACHQLDARQSVWSSVTEEANMLGALKAAPKAAPGKTIPNPPEVPHQTTAIPALTWLGEKLQPSWSAAMIAGQLPEKTRPYVYGRMPAFEHYADVLARGLSHWHGFPARGGELSDGKPFEISAVQAGEMLVSEQGGFACTACHDLGKRKATAPFEAPALNLVKAGARLRLTYFERWLLQPQRLDPETKMPRYSDAAKKTGIKHVMDGDAEQQFNAIRGFLLSVKE